METQTRSWLPSPSRSAYIHNSKNSSDIEYFKELEKNFDDFLDKHESIGSNHGIFWRMTLISETS